MRVSFEWLSKLIDIDITVEQLAEKMTMSGIAVEEIEDQAGKYQGIVTAKVLSLDQHQHADNLFIVKADAGEWGIKQVITAAKNLVVGNIVPLALAGSTLPDGKQIDEVNFKGVQSQGMLCSGAELGLEKESTGIWVFGGSSFKLGQAVAEVLGETDRVLVLELTANRPDCLGMIGVAREVAAILNKKFIEKPITLKEAGKPVEQQAKVDILDPDLCPRYAARVVNHVKIAPSPEWMQRRLKAAGVRPINNIVDITNYVMLEYNQPLHAFDLDHIADHHIQVRRARSSEKLVTLDNIERKLSPENLLIADTQNGLCVAGVMGGATSEIMEETQNMLLEAAYFNPSSIRKTGKQLGMKTEAQIRFERGIDPNGVIKALNRAAQLVEELGAGEVAKGYVDQYPKTISPLTIHTSTSRINALLGTNISASKIRDYLERVTFEVKLKGQDNLEVTVPTYRQDVSYMADLAEEVARLYGYKNIAATIPESTQIGSLTAFQKMQQTCRKLLQGIGISEVMTYSLYAASTAKRLGIASEDKLAKTIPLMVPLSEEQAVMRTHLVHHLLEVLAFNTKRRQTDISVYEIARVYWPKGDGELPEEPLHIGVGLMGRPRETGWNQSREEVDFYDAKGVVELIFEKLRFPEMVLKPSGQPFFHPGQSADVYVNGKMVGFFGQIHPNIGTLYELSKKAFIIELDLTVLDGLRQTDILTFQPLPKFPAVQRDLALVVSTQVTAQEIIGKIQKIVGEWVEKVDLFDVYQGEQVQKGMRSMAFSITYRSKDRTLNDNEVNEMQQKLLTELNEEYGAKVRA